MAQSFGFKFDNDDIELDSNGENDMEMGEAPSVSREEAPLIEPQIHSLQEMVCTWTHSFLH